ncbi:hypothetical protein, partial [Agrobacterium vitis]|uniref:hypothetical protein n=1 Tax=Agrobacterium vitis TaxID=373 RepID=UPI001AED8FF7
GRSRAEERRKGKPLDQSLIRKPYLELAHFSMEKPAQFHAKTNKQELSPRLCFSSEHESALIGSEFAFIVTGIAKRRMFSEPSNPRLCGGPDSF